MSKITVPLHTDLYSTPDYKGVDEILQNVKAALPENWQTPQEWVKQVEAFIKNNNDYLAESNYLSAFK